MNREFEIKARLDQASKISPFLEKLSFIKETQVTDIYYDTEDGDLFKNGIFVRVRDGKQFDIKYNPDFLDNRHVVCHEYSYNFPLSTQHTLEASVFLQQQSGVAFSDNTGLLGLSKFVPIIKHRKLYEGLGLEVALDTIDNLGMFIEIESIGETDEEVLNLQQQLGLTHIPVGYVELYLKKHNLSLYKQGRYILEEDRT